ncbi:unnamed protein product [Pedinophyceae sp. YPF-701]|nr:unnamed protein product [Pedinophyceae sp. YPF-701]
MRLILLGCGGHQDVLAADARSEINVPELIDVEKNTLEFTLPNGVHVIVAERPGSGKVSTHTYASVGAWDEEVGRTGIVSLITRMSYSGTRGIGTESWEREAPLLEAQDETFYALRTAQREGRDKEVPALREQLKALRDEAAELQTPDAWLVELDRLGVTSVRARCSHDWMRWTASMPVGALPTWFDLERKRFRDPVWRGIYDAKQAVAAERSQLEKGAPLGEFQERFAHKAFQTNYRRPLIGYKDDVELLWRREVDSFFRKKVVPSAVTIAVVGDVSAADVERMAAPTIGEWVPRSSPVRPAPENEALKPRTGPPAPKADPAAPMPLDVVDEKARGSNLRDTIIMPGQIGVAPPPPSKSATNILRFESDAGPLLLEGFYRPPTTDKQSVAMDFLADMLAVGQESRFHEALLTSGIASRQDVVASFPGVQRDSLFLTLAVPAPGKSLDDVSRAVRGAVDGLTQEVTPEELERVKRRIRSAQTKAVLGDASLAGLLCKYHAVHGSWRALGEDLRAASVMSTEAVQSAAQTLFVAERRFTGQVRRPKPKKEKEEKKEAAAGTPEDAPPAPGPEEGSEPPAAPSQA